MEETSRQIEIGGQYETGRQIETGGQNETGRQRETRRQYQTRGIEGQENRVGKGKGRDSGKS
jgi:hypothetical protein